MHQYDISNAAYYCAAQRIFGMRPSVGLAVIDYCDGIQNLFSLSQSELKSLSRFIPECRKVSSKLVDSSYKELSILMNNGIRFISCNDSYYPIMLKEINNYPLGIYVKGKDTMGNLLNDTKLLGVVGGKSISAYGQSYCDMVIDTIIDKRKDTGIITRLTNGIDSTVNQIAKDKEVLTVSVIPYGFPKRSNTKTYDSTIIITDMPPGEAPSHLSICRRDRIVSALSRAIILVESDSLNFSYKIIESSYSYGKEIWAFPGPVNCECYRYNNKLIRLNIAEIISGKEDLKQKIERL